MLGCLWDFGHLFLYFKCLRPTSICNLLFFCCSFFIYFIFRGRHLREEKTLHDHSHSCSQICTVTVDLAVCDWIVTVGLLFISYLTFTIIIFVFLLFFPFLFFLPSSSSYSSFLLQPTSSYSLFFFLLQPTVTIHCNSRIAKYDIFCGVLILFLFHLFFFGFIFV